MTATTDTHTIADLYHGRLVDLLNDAAADAQGVAEARRTKLREIADKATAGGGLSPFDDDSIVEYRLAAEVEAVLANLAYLVETGTPRRSESVRRVASIEERIAHVRELYSYDARRTVEDAASGYEGGFSGCVGQRARAAVLVAIRSADERAFSGVVREIVADSGDGSDPQRLWQDLVTKRRDLATTRERARSETKIAELDVSIARVDVAIETAKANLDGARADAEEALLRAIGGRVV